MKMKPPASSKSPTSRKKPRIMHHLFLGRPGRAGSGNNGVGADIQPFQAVKLHRGRFRKPRKRREGVDAGKPPLYKGADGGGCNPAAAVLWAAPGASGGLAWWRTGCGSTAAAAF